MEEMHYFDMINLPDNKTDKKKENEDSCKDTNKTVLEHAFGFANSCRDKEIDRFWTRGLYFWGFIAASFGAYMAVFNASLKNDSGIKIQLSFESILEMSFTAKTALFVLSFICFIFCLSWLLVHKGSKFWQQNWEHHICYLENEYMGKIYKSHLDSENNKKFNKNIFKTNAYDFSVSKISLLCSMLLTVCSFCLAIFHLIIIVTSTFGFNYEDIKSWNLYVINAVKIILVVLLLIGTVFFLWYFWKHSKGNQKVSYDIEHDYFVCEGKTIKILNDNE